MFVCSRTCRSRHCSQSRGRGSPSWRSRLLAWDTASSKAKCFLFFPVALLPLPSESEDEPLGHFIAANRRDVGPSESSGCTSIACILS